MMRFATPPGLMSAISGRFIAFTEYESSRPDPLLCSGQSPCHPSQLGLLLIHVISWQVPSPVCVQWQSEVASVCSSQRYDLTEQPFES